MASIFHYNNLQVSLDASTKSLKVLLNRPEKENAFNHEMVFELEGLLAWVSAHLEIETLYFGSTSAAFSKGIDLEEMSFMGEEKSFSFYEKISRLIEAIRCLPQTTIINLGNKATNLGMEFALAFDVRLASDEGLFAFDHIQYGMLPQCGAATYLRTEVPTGFVKKWLLSGNSINTNEMINSGLVTEVYQADQAHNTTEKYLKMFTGLAPVQKIQCKNIIQHLGFEEINANKEAEKKNLTAARMTGDWASTLEAFKRGKSPEYIPSKSFGYALQKAKAKEIAEQ